MTGESGLDSRRGRKLFLLITVILTVLGPEQAAVRKQNIRGLKQTTPLHLGLKAKRDWRFTSNHPFAIPASVPLQLSTERPSP
jgi:hypothetical protein